ncbi:hypothetical protein DFS33DRAFT_1447672 [Desarmillaria ectypa]|nr:hypothetical protein DFS33DRAFT_1447672 [Desarmillaria ectypa]
MEETRSTPRLGSGPVIFSDPTSFSEASESISSPSFEATASSDSESSFTFNPGDYKHTSTGQNAISLTCQTSLTGITASSTTSSSPHGTSSYIPHSHKPQQTRTIIGVVIGSIFFIRRLRQIQIPSSPYSVVPDRRHRIRPSSQGTNLAGKGRRRVTSTRTISMTLDDNVPGPSVSGSAAEREGVRILPDEAVPYTNTSAEPHAMNDEVAAEILRLSTQIQQLITQRASVWHPNKEPDPPPAYVEDVTISCSVPIQRYDVLVNGELDNHGAEKGTMEITVVSEWYSILRKNAMNDSS